jgi:hypothetical protein
VKFIFIFSVRLLKIALIYLFQVVEIEGTFGVHTFVDDEVFTVFLRNQDMSAVRTAQSQRLIMAADTGRKAVITDLAHQLALGTVVLIEVDHGSTTTRTAGLFWNITGRASADRFHFTAVTLPVIALEVVPVPVLFRSTDDRKLVDREFLVLWGVGILMGPLFEWNVSADKVQ